MVLTEVHSAVAVAVAVVADAVAACFACASDAAVVAAQAFVSGVDAH